MTLSKSGLSSLLDFFPDSPCHLICGHIYFGFAPTVVSFQGSVNDKSRWWVTSVFHLYSSSSQKASYSFELNKVQYVNISYNPSLCRIILSLVFESLFLIAICFVKLCIEWRMITLIGRLIFSHFLFYYFTNYNFTLLFAVYHPPFEWVWHCWETLAVNHIGCRFRFYGIIRLLAEASTYVYTGDAKKRTGRTSIAIEGLAFRRILALNNGVGLIRRDDTALLSSSFLS